MKLFTAPDTWTGGFYELSVDVPTRDWGARGRALAMLWSLPGLTGPYAHPDREPDQQPRLDLASLPLEGHLHGVATFSGGRQSACGSYCFEDEWISLNEVFPLGGYPFEETTPRIAGALSEVQGWLRRLGEALHPKIGFGVGIVGFESHLYMVKGQTRRESSPNGAARGSCSPARAGWSGIRRRCSRRRAVPHFSEGTWTTARSS
jgi:hypothetical protein